MEIALAMEGSQTGCSPPVPRHSQFVAGTEREDRQFGEGSTDLLLGETYDFSCLRSTYTFLVGRTTSYRLDPAGPRRARTPFRHILAPQGLHIYLQSRCCGSKETAQEHQFIRSFVAARFPHRFAGRERRRLRPAGSD